MVVLISDKVHALSLPSPLITVFAAVAVFALSYRTHTAVGRFDEGRRYWSAIALAGRALARTIWMHVPLETPPDGATEEEKAQLRLKAIEEKKEAIHLIDKFAFSVKDYLRRGKDIYHQVDLTQGNPKSAFSHPPEVKKAVSPTLPTLSPSDEPESAQQPPRRSPDLKKRSRRRRLLRERRRAMRGYQPTSGRLLAAEDQ